jgi:hypothetical protein
VRYTVSIPISVPAGTQERDAASRRRTPSGTGERRGPVNRSLMVVGRRWVAPAALLASTASPAMAQGRVLGAFARQDLRFGVVVPGLPTVVTRLDANAGRFEIRGARRAEVTVTFTIPSELATPLGGRMTIRFQPNDGGYSTTPADANSRAFDPRVPLVTTLSPAGRLHLWLGGTVAPDAIQPAGRYEATITLTVSYTGA